MPKIPQWSRFEQQVAKDFKASVTPSSGNQWFAKGDVSSKEYKISCKSTDKESFTLKKADWLEIQKIAFASGVVPLLAVDLNGKKLIILDYDEYLSSIEE